MAVEMVEAFDAGDDPIGRRPVDAELLQGYIDRAWGLGWSLTLDDFAILDGELCIDSKYPDDFIEELQGK
ncbi:hypothetical protein ACFRAQ_34805 [Nocardia sp. NPDC056611]|uniref:hypothetical protein n=1 Tax=Nocardia sp. NPDC056611 TaxID=3345877 RepID=UPI003670A02F